MLVVLRIALVRSDIGVFLNDPGPRLAGSIEKDALRRCCAPKDFHAGLAARAMRQANRPTGEVRRERAYRV